MGTVTLAPLDDTFGPSDGVFSGIGPGTAQQGTGRIKRVTATFAGTYATGGDTFPVATLGLRNVNTILIEQLGPAFPQVGPGIHVALGGTSAAPKLMAFVAATGGSGAVAEVANGVNLGGKSVRIWLIGD